MKRICLDFDFTIFNKSAGMIYPQAKEVINKWSSEGHEITIFTNRPDYDYSTIQCILADNDIAYDRLICGKPSWDLYIGDRCQKFEGWDNEYTV